MYFVPNGVALFGNDVAVESLLIVDNVRVPNSKPPYVLELPVDANGDYFLQTTQDTYNTTFALYYGSPPLKEN